MNTNMSRKEGYGSYGSKHLRIFLQLVVVAIAITAIAVMAMLPLTEGAAVNKDLLQIYLDPFIMFGYLASVPFFIALYQVFKLLGNMKRNIGLSPAVVKALGIIKYCAIIQAGLVILAAAYIRTFHAKDDDPAGFIALCIITTLVCIIVAAAATVFKKHLKKRGEHEIREGFNKQS